MRNNTGDPKVSIIIPVYNGEKYLKYAIDSALSQTYKNLEILVINDGSTDKTDKIAKSYGDKIKYIKKENGGVSSALNLGIKEMSGEYFSWLSHDDTYEPDKVEAEIDYLKKHKLLHKKAIVFSDYYLINSKGKIIAESRKDHEEIEKKPEYSLIKGHINGLSLLIPKQAFDDYGFFDTEMVCVQDYEMWRKMAKTYDFYHIPKLLVSTRYHAKQVSNTSPKVVTEGNDFYRRAIAEVSPKRMAEIEGSEYSFLMEVAKFHQNTVYKDVAEECKNKANKILEKTKNQTKNIKVSIIIPFYNRADKTERALESIFRQTHKNYEIILVNDGSDENIDNIKKIADLKQIKLINLKKNSGPSTARNIGIKESSGDYIVFLDSDDQFEENKIERQLQYALASNANILHTSYLRCMENEEKIIHSGNVTGHCNRKLIYNCPIATPTVMIKNSWLKNRGVYFNESVEIGEDTCFWLELLKDDSALLGIDEPLTRVNVGKNAAAYNVDKQIIGLKTIIKYLLNSDYYSKYDLEISRLMDAYSAYVKRGHQESEPLVDGSPVHKLLFYVKNEGIRNASKRVIKKTKEMIRGNKN